jgi:glycosyltransferase involved in cell wall biosynthesis
VHSHHYPLAVIIPTYNRADALLQCLRHLEKQTYREFEVIVVDDGSTDATLAVFDAYARKSELALRCVRQENCGPARARNHAISLVEAPLCLMIGDDIFASPDMIERHVELHRQRPDPTVAALGLTRWSETGQMVTPFMRWMDSDGMQFDYGRLLGGQQPDWRHFYTSNLSVKTGLLKQYPFDETFPYAAMEDIELACRIEARHGLEIVFLPEAVAHHFHPITFAQACRRMIRVGESTACFDAMWPGKIPRKISRVKRALKNRVVRSGALPLFVKLADLSLRVLCPNRLMQFVLGCHFAIGYDRGTGRAQAAAAATVDPKGLDPEALP